MVNKEKIIEVLIKEYGEKKLMRLYDSEYSDIFKDVIKLTEKQAKKETAKQIFEWLDNQEYFHYGEGSYEEFIKEYIELKQAIKK